MSIARTASAQMSSLTAKIIDIEIDISRGLNAFSIVGLAHKSVEEAKDRISAAIKNAGFTSPKSKNQKIVIALAPANLKKEGAGFDLAMAMGYLLATQEISFDPKEKLFLGELALDGSLRELNGVFVMTQEAKRAGYKEIFLPEKNALEATLVDGITIYGATHIRELIAHLNTKPLIEISRPISPKKILPTKKAPTNGTASEATKSVGSESSGTISLEDVKGQNLAKRVLEIAAAGGHNVLLSGPPGTGKTMLAKAFTALLPDLSTEERLDVTAIYSASGQLMSSVVARPPFRSPHHTSSYSTLLGGGANLAPGEISLAHHGVLFLDEFPEFDKRVIESLRQPLEERSITVRRAKGTEHFPSDFIFIAAMNPCPCGFFGAKEKRCLCAQSLIERYRKKISGPIADRIDLWTDVYEVEYETLGQESQQKESGEVGLLLKKILQARAWQKDRFKSLGLSYNLNNKITAKEIERAIKATPEALATLTSSAKKLGLSARGFHRTLRVARTIADLAESERVENPHILEALQYRKKI